MHDTPQDRFPQAHRPGDARQLGALIRRRVFPLPALPRPRIVVPQAGAFALAKLVGYFRPLWPDEIDAALAEGEAGRIEGVHPGKLFRWKLDADIGLSAARMESPPAPSGETGAERRGAVR